MPRARRHWYRVCCSSPENSRASLQARFQGDVLLRLDQAFGRADERITPVRPTEELVMRRVFDEAATQLEAVLLTVQELLTELSALLLARGERCTRIAARLIRTNDPPASREIMLGHASRDVKHLWSLFRPKIEGMHLGYGVEEMILIVTWLERRPAQSAGHVEKCRK